MANLSKVIYINEEDYSTLINGGSLVIDGTTYTYEESALYVIKNVSPPEYAETAGYATNAGTSQVAVTDASGNNIATTYEKKPLVIEVSESNYGLYLEQGTYDDITQALILGKLVILKLTRDYNDNEILYLPLLTDYTETDESYYFRALSGNLTSYMAEINSHDEFYYVINTLAKDDLVVHKANTETITGDKTFTGTVSLGSKATATTPTATDNDTSVATTAFVHNVVNALPEITTGQVVGRMHRDNVSGTGNLTITGASGEGFSPNGITTAGKYIVVVYSWSDTKTFGYNISFGSNNYTLSTTDGTISDKRELTVSAGALWSGSVTVAVSAGTTIIVEIYKAEKTTPALSVGTTAITNLYADLDGKPTISSSTSSSSTTDIASSKAVKLAYDHGGVQSVNGLTGAVNLALGDTNVIESISVNGVALTITNKNVDITLEIPEGELSENYATSELENEDLMLAPGDTYEEAFSKVEKAILDNEETVAGALNDLNERLLDVDSAIQSKQDILTSGTNIKTINNESLLGSGNITIQTSGTVTSVGAQGVSGSHISVTNSPITTSGTLSIGIESGYSIPSVANQTTWNNAIRGLTVDSFSNPGIGATSLTPDNNKNVTLYLDDVFAYNNKLLLLNANGDAINYITVALDAITGVTSDQALITGGYLNQVLPSTTLSNNYAPSTDTNENLILEAGDTYEEAFAKLEKTINDNETITATALTDLDGRIPTKTSDLTNDSGFITQAPVSSVNGQTDAVVISEATISNSGLMSSTDKSKLDRLKEKVVYDFSGYTYGDTVISVEGLQGTCYGYDNENLGESVIADINAGKNVVLQDGDGQYYYYSWNLGTLFYTFSAIAAEHSLNILIIPYSNKESAQGYNIIFNVHSMQEQLISGTNIKTINNQSLLGEGNITIQGGSGGDTNVIETVKVNGTALTPDSNKAVDITVPTTLDSISDGNTRKLSNYLPLSGGTMTGAITVAPGDGKGLLFSTTSNINVSGTTNTILGFYNGTYIIGHTAYPVNIRGTNTRPNYNGNQLALYSDIPSAVTESTVSGWGFTKNAGTVTGVKMNGTTNNPTNGVVDLGTVLTSFTETDPTVPAWAKAASKPTYTAAEVGALPDTYTPPVTSVNGQTGAVNLIIPAAVTESTVSGWGFTKNAGTITGITMNGSSKGTSGVVNLGTVATANNYVTGGSVNSSNGTISLTRQGLGDASVTGLNTYVSNMISTALTATGGYNDTYVAKAGDTMTGALTVNAAAANTVNIIGGDNSSGNQIALNVGSGTHANMFQVFDDGSAHIVANGTLEVTPASGQTGLEITSAATTDTALTTNGKVIANQFVKSGGTSSLLLRADGSVMTFPAFSSADNGKVLSVVNGSLAWVTPTSIYSGTSEPNNNTGNNGDLYLQTS